MLKDERDRFAAFAFSWGDILLELDRAGVIAHVAGPLGAVTGRPETAALGVPLRDLVMPAAAPVVDQLIRIAAKRGRIDAEPIELKRADGEPVSVLLSGYALGDINEHVFIALRLSQPPAAPGSRDDPVAAFADRAGAAISRLDPAAGERAALTLITLRNFRALSDRLHADTRASLQASLGLYLKTNALDSGLVAEMEDGAFGFLHSTGLAIDQIKRQIEEISRQFDPQGHGLTADVAAVSLKDAASLDSVDVAKGVVYAINRFRHGGTAGFDLARVSRKLTDFVAEAANDITSFKSIVADGRFSVVFQPIVSLSSGRIHHYEALCRFDHAGDGESPYRYIRFAEETGLIHAFDLAMAAKVIEWLRTKPINRSGYEVAVNLSGHSLQQERYVEPLLKLLAANPWTRGKLLFEITESARIGDLAMANAVIQQLRSRGHEVCLDDFGSGAASFEYLSHLDIDVIKLDGQAVKSALQAQKGRAFLSALAGLCGKLGVRTVAEMIDDERALDFVASCGCDFVQGYLFGRPDPDIRRFQPLPNANLIRRLQWRVV